MKHAFVFYIGNCLHRTQNALRQSENIRITNEIFNATGQFFLGNYLTFSLLILSKLIYFNDVSLNEIIDIKSFL